jgi:hypothetical protein
MGLDSEDVTSNAPELGFFCALTTLFSLALLDHIDGKLSRIHWYLASRKWPFMDTDSKYFKYVTYFRFIIYIYLSLPILTLLLWTIVLFYIKDRDGQDMLVPLCVVLVGFAIIFFLLSVFSIKWNKCRPTTSTVVFMILAAAFFIAYQLAANFASDEKSFFGITSVFLCYNGIIILLIIFMNSGHNGMTVTDMIAELPPRPLEEDELEANMTEDQKNEEPFEAIMERQLQNDKYMPSREEISKFYTIEEGKFETSVISGGIQKIFTTLTRKKQLCYSGIWYIICIGILVAYSFIIYHNTSEYKLGFVTMISTLSTDLILYLYHYAGIADSVNQLSFIAIVFRICLFAFGGDYWVYGYCILYIILGLILGWSTINHRFPLASGIRKKMEKVTEDVGQFKFKVDLVKSSEFVFIFATAVFAVLIIILETVQPDGVPLTSLHYQGTEYKYWYFALMSVLAVLICFCFMGVWRLFQRKKKRVKGKIYYYFYFFYLNSYWAFVLGAYFFIIIAGLVAFGFTDNYNFIILTFFLPFIWILAMHSYCYYINNDYHILQDIGAENKKKATLRKRAYKIKQKLAHFKRHGGGKGIFSSGEISKNLSMFKGIGDSPLAKVKEIDAKFGPEEEEDKLEGLFKHAMKEGTGWSEEKKAENRGVAPKREEEEEKEEDIDEFESGAKKAEVESSRKDGATAENVDEDKKKELPPPIAASVSKKESENVVIGKATLVQLQKDLKSSEMEDITDWRSHHSCLCALMRGKLRPNDYHILAGLILNPILIILAGILIEAVSDSSDTLYGVHLIFLLLTVSMIGCPLIKYFAIPTSFSLIQVIFVCLGFIIHYLYGIYAFFIKDQGDLHIHYNILFLIFYWFCIPLVICLGSALYKTYKLRWHINSFVIFMIILSVFICIGLGISIIYMVSVSAALALFIVALLILYFVWVAKIYVNHNYYLPRRYRIVNTVLLILACLVAMVVSWFVQDFDQFVGFSITYGLIFLAILFYGGSKMLRDLKRSEEAPIFFSPWIFPIYKYDPEADDIISRNLPSLCIFFVGFGAIFWSILLSVWVSPMHLGISISTVILILLTFLTLFLITWTPVQFKEAMDCKTDKMIKKAWLDSKKEFITGRNALNLKELYSYSERAELQEQLTLRIKEVLGGMKEANDQYEWNIDNIDPSSITQLYGLLYKFDEVCEETYFEEIKILVQFELMIIISGLNAKNSERKFMICFVSAKEVQLKAEGIEFDIKGIPNRDLQYITLMDQISKLSAKDAVYVNNLKEEFKKEEGERKKQDALREIEEARQEAERKAKLIEKEAKRKAALEREENADFYATPIGELLDSRKKFERIITEWRDTSMSAEFKDTQFDNEDPDSCLGEKVLGRVKGWKKSTDPDRECEEGGEMVMYKGDISAMDVKQGMLGDCYFLSAISVMGDKHVRAAILNKDDEYKSGAFCVRFFKGGEPHDQEICIVDNLFPVDYNGNWLFCKSESGTELWPMVLEKAYAKFYGTYSDIEAGKVQYALADLTGGAPEQIKVEAYRNNLNALWKKMYHSYKEGYLMGAGSPEHAMGDSAISDDGIVQGHAYAILQLALVQDEMILRIRNPHGTKGVEWMGDWSDSSDKWNSAYFI